MYYYTFLPLAKSYPTKVTVITPKGSKSVDISNNDLWSLSSYNRTLSSTNADHSCFLSPNGKKLACSLSERESSFGAGTGVHKLVVYDVESEQLDEVLTTDKVFQPEGSLVTFLFEGWKGNDALLFIHLNGGFGPSKPTDFYTVNIKNKKVTQELSYNYGLSAPLVLNSDGKFMFFVSVNVNYQRPPEQRVIEQLVEYNFETKETKLITATSEGFSSAHYSLAQDQKKLLYYTALDKLLHIYELENGKEVTMKMPQAIASVETLLSDNKTFIVNMNGEKAALFDNSTQKFEELKGIFIGL